MSTRRSTARGTPFARRWPRDLTFLSLALLAGCAPRGSAPTGPSPAPGAAPPNRPATLEPLPSAITRLAPPVRVGVVVDSPSVEVAANGRFTVSAGGREVARVEPGSTARFTAESGGRVTLTVGSGRSHRGLELPVTLESRDASTLLRVRGNPYRGALVLQRAADGSGLTVVNRLDMESYLLGVVPREIGRASEDIYQAVKAQAVAARTYAVKYMGRRSAQGFDVYATVDDQVYGGAGAEDPIVNRAVRETAGQVLTYAGQPITAYYHSTCAGRTAAIDEVWNEAPVPYLVSVVDTDASGQAYDRASSRFTWTERWTHAQLVSTLNRTLADSLRGRTITQIRDMRVLERTQSGRVRAMRIETDAGNFTVGKDRVRWILVPTRGGILNSSKFDVRLTRDGGRVTEIVAEGGGWGHGIGMCQVGAMGRARAGQDYRTILRTYYPGTEIRDSY
ncbi:MAG TPA: SpoIID/LytB domain-containing protein [Longimicrobium sp.]|nr:SpoIID/LytB domain-containing protein [Longimicrobium sp.]